jgi:hypothetical protein
MAISNETAYDSLLTQPFMRMRLSKNALTTVAGRSFSSWLQGGSPAAGSAPTTAAAPTNATAGALLDANGQFFNGTNMRLLKTITDMAITSPGAMITICDRVGHQGGLSATVTTAQSTNLPTAALTRYTSGVGVQVGLEIYTVIGTTGTTVSCSYTDQSSGAGNASPLATFGNTGFREASRIITLPLAVGDTGVKSVENVTVTASTLTAGNFGVTLYYPLVHIPVDDVLALKGYADALHGFGTWFPQIQSSACLFMIYHTLGTTTGVVQGDLLICEDR